MDSYILTLLITLTLLDFKTSIPSNCFDDRVFNSFKPEWAD
jgi:hypothetical protein